MSLDYLIPLALAVLMLSAPSLLLARALWQRPRSGIPRRRKASAFRPDKRQAYHLSRAAVLSCTCSSLLCAVITGAVMAAWLPLPQADRALLATLAAPLVWAALVLFLLARGTWLRDCALAVSAGLVALGAVLLPMLGR